MTVSLSANKSIKGRALWTPSGAVTRRTLRSRNAAQGRGDCDALYHPIITPARRKCLADSLPPLAWRPNLRPALPGQAAQGRRPPARHRAQGVAVVLVGVSAPVRVRRRAGGAAPRSGPGTPRLGRVPVAWAPTARAAGDRPRADEAPAGATARRKAVSAPRSGGKSNARAKNNVAEVRPPPGQDQNRARSNRFDPTSNVGEISGLGESNRTGERLAFVRKARINRC